MRVVMTEQERREFFADITENYRRGEISVIQFRGMAQEKGVDGDLISMTADMYSVENIRNWRNR